MKYFRVWWKGKRIGAPYDVYAFKYFRFTTDKDNTYVIKLGSDEVHIILNKFIERLDFTNERY